MRDNEINIFYQYNSKNEINNTELLTDSYLLIEHQRNFKDKFDYKTMLELLTNDGVDFEKIKRIYIVKEKSKKNKIILNTLSDGNFKCYKDEKDLYLHLEIKEDLYSNKREINLKIEKYNSLILDLDKKYKDISEEMKKIKNSNLISDNNIYDIIKKKKEEEQIAKMNNLRSSYVRLNEGKKDIYVLYLFCSIFDLKRVNYEENEYYEEIKYIYDLFKKTPKISAELRFEPLINLNDNNFKDCFENIPDIIHININSIYLNEELNYNNLGETITKYETILEKLGSQKDISKVKLLILSSDKDGKIKEHFKKVKNIIYLNDLKKQQIENNTFYKDFYSNILKCYSIEQAFERSNHVNYNKKISGQEIYILPPEILNKDDNKYKNDVVINPNCSLNLDFVKYNYNRILGRNTQIQNCIEKIQEKSRNILVYGGIGAGKKSLVQAVGKYFFEREYHGINKIEYIEIYDIDSVEEILRDKIKKLNEENIINKEDNIAIGYSPKILLIIIFNFLIDEEAKLGYIENAINSKKEEYKNIIFLYTCTTEKISKERLSVNKTSIKLEQIKNKKDVSFLLNHIVKETFDLNRERDKVKNFLKLKKISEFPNYFFFKALYIKKIGIENANNNMKTTENLLSQFLKQMDAEYKLKKIICIFYILNLGIRDDIIYNFCKWKDLDNIKNNLNYIIRSEADREGNIYLMDGYFRRILNRIFQKDEINCKHIKEYLLIIMENYAKILRYIVNTSDFPYDLCKEFHAGINQGIWFSLHESKFKDIYEKFCAEMKDKKIFFDDIRYFYNIKAILENIKYINIIKDNIDDFKEYISQIIICLPTILYFKKNNLLLEKTLDIFERILMQFLSVKNYWKKDILRFKIFKYWKSRDPYDFKSVKELIQSKDSLYEDMNFDIKLIEIYNMIQEKIEYENIGKQLFKDCQICAKNDLNLIRLNILYGKAENYQSKEYFQEAYSKAKKINNKMIKLTLIELAEYFLINSKFDDFNKCVAEYQEIKDKDDKYDKNLYDLIKNKNEKYKNANKNKLFFYTSELFFEYEKNLDENSKPTALNTEANNSFYLKYNLKLRMPQDKELIFQSIKEDFLDELKKKFQNPSKFIYIGCDYFNQDGEIFYLDEDFKTKPISTIELKNIIKECKNKPDMIILWFINSEIIANDFIKNNFQNVIFLKKSDTFKKLLIKPYFNFYFQRCLHKIIADFIVTLDKKTIKEALIDLEENLANELINLKSVDNSISSDINFLIQQEIIDCKNITEKEDKAHFDDMNVSRNNSLTNNNIIINEIISEQNEDIFNESEKKIDFKTINLNTNLKFDEELEKSNFEFLIHKRYFGNKNLFYKSIKKLFEYKIINIYGKSNSGKTALCLELCKYFFMNKYFKNGIYYYTNCKKLKDLKNKLKNEKEKVYDNSLIILDDENNINSNTNYINSINSYFIIISTESLKKSPNKNNKKPKKKNSGIIKSLNMEQIDQFINANIPLSNSGEDFYWYMVIKSSILKNDLNIIKKMEETKEQVFIQDILGLLDYK